jgi:hypothetical protein
LLYLFDLFLFFCLGWTHISFFDIFERKAHGSEL